MAQKSEKMAEKGSSSFPKLNAMNYHNWLLKSEWTLKKKKLRIYVDCRTARLEPTSKHCGLKRFDEQSEIAQATIKLGVAFELKSRARTMQLKRGLVDNKCAESEPMDG
ncbi:hypothetical protein M514_10166 [Trichuris suis]|uniref:Uncharacterized protein n=1 Tax=Trichuris suis TaxID=68888 RepID=A0A085NG87_9BILA|nr:hypothetical protein M513_10166 [Trichuris suis]KFD68483.1 hypothetical protein M514_10166 [Trichuris suis]